MESTLPTDTSNNSVIPHSCIYQLLWYVLEVSYAEIEFLPDLTRYHCLNQHSDSVWISIFWKGRGKCYASGIVRGNILLFYLNVLPNKNNCVTVFVNGTKLGVRTSFSTHACWHALACRGSLRKIFHKHWFIGSIYKLKLFTLFLLLSSLWFLHS